MFADDVNPSQNLHSSVLRDQFVVRCNSNSAGHTVTHYVRRVLVPVST